MVEKKLVLFVLLLCCYAVLTSESGDYGGLYISTVSCIALTII